LDDQLNRQNREKSWQFLMSVVFTMSTDAQFDFSFDRATGPLVRRLLSNDATLCRWSPTINATIYVTVDDRYVSKKIERRSQANFSMI
jgi:hypothetical protein